jgi:hypothetical protein
VRAGSSKTVMLLDVVALLAFADIRAGSSNMFASLVELVLLDCAYASIPVKKMTMTKVNVKVRTAFEITPL